MDEKEKKTVETISAEMIDEVINSIKKAEEEHPELKAENTDTEKVKEVLESLKGCTAHTVVGVVSTAFLLLPAGAIMACLNMGKQALSAKVLSGIMRMAGKCPACSEEEAPEATEAPEAPAE